LHGKWYFQQAASYGFSGRFDLPASHLFLIVLNSISMMTGMLFRFFLNYF